MPDVVMPRLSDSMEEGTILQWLKHVGDEIAIGDELVEIETDKANMAYEADVAGTLTEIVAAEGETLPIGSVIARIGEGNGTPPPTQTSEEPPPPPETRKPAATPQATEAPSGDGRPKASPVARRIAKEHGVELAELSGSGPGGRIVKADVEKAASAAGGAVGGTAPEEASATAGGGGSPAATGPAAQGHGPNASPETAKGQVTYEDLSKLQSTIARRMAESKATAPHFYLEAEIDMSRLVAARGQIKDAAKEGDVVPSFNDMVVKACALGLREHPRANGAYRDGRFELYSRVNVGVAVAADDALVVPTIFDADQKSLRQIASEGRTLAQRVRDGRITPPELSGATFTVSNLGMFGIDSFAAVINPPQAAILAVGAIAERPVVRDRAQLATAHLMRVNLACDHRILYGAPAAEFLARIKSLLEEPLSLAL
jgi:pyruvate dehydrogenase E2 component (dihydrolipoamide acetyltransferase)